MALQGCPATRETKPGRDFVDTALHAEKRKRISRPFDTRGPPPRRIRTSSAPSTPPLRASVGQGAKATVGHCVAVWQKPSDGSRVFPRPPRGARGRRDRRPRRAGQGGTGVTSTTGDGRCPRRARRPVRASAGELASRRSDGCFRSRPEFVAAPLEAATARQLSADGEVAGPRGDLALGAVRSSVPGGTEEGRGRDSQRRERGSTLIPLILSFPPSAAAVSVPPGA